METRTKAFLDLGFNKPPVPARPEDLLLRLILEAQHPDIGLDLLLDARDVHLLIASSPTLRLEKTRLCPISMQENSSISLRQHP